jgi:hypothetical protein
VGFESHNIVADIPVSRLGLCYNLTPQVETSAERTNYPSRQGSDNSSPLLMLVNPAELDPPILCPS